MSAEDEIRKLTIDPGPIALARLFDNMQARVDACCGGSLNAAKAQPKTDESGGASPTSKAEPAGTPKT